MSRWEGPRQLRFPHLPFQGNFPSKPENARNVENAQRRSLDPIALPTARSDAHRSSFLALPPCPKQPHECSLLTTSSSTSVHHSSYGLFSAPTSRVQTAPATMAAASKFEDSIRAAEFHHAEYIKHMRLMHEAVASQHADTHVSLLTSPVARSEPDDENPASIAPILKRLPTEQFTADEALQHLSSLRRTNEETRFWRWSTLGRLWTTSSPVTTIERLFGPPLDDQEGDGYRNASCVVHEIDQGGQSRRLYGDQVDQTLPNPSREAWSMLSSINEDGSAVGRITMLEEPSPPMILAIHMTMQKHFDMDEVFHNLITAGGDKTVYKTKAFLDSRSFEANPLRRRSFFITLKYYTVVGDGFSPARWQYRASRSSPSHPPSAAVDIVECSSILCLSLSGEPVKRVGLETRNSGRTQGGELYDTNAPWHILNIQCFPDDESSPRPDYAKETFCNGPHAFLFCLSVEYRNAIRRYRLIHKRIKDLIIPPRRLIHDSFLRDHVQFEDPKLTFSRQYFWAYNALTIINATIQGMRDTYSETFNDEFWAGRHETLWPHPDPHSPAGKAYVARLLPLRKKLEDSVQTLQLLHDENEQTREQIHGLREQLYGASAEEKSRKAIEQGKNIKILTSVSMIFLPLTFVTSVFGMTNFEFGDRDWQFIVIMVAVGVPFFLLIFLLQTHKALRKGRRKLYFYVRNIIWILDFVIGMHPSLHGGFWFLRRLPRIPLQVWSSFRKKIWDRFVKRRARSDGENQTEMV
ncbi:cora-like Mg2+ transporter protein-domain-containing protein [Echria macrotheca]|uniref:Cora-like Mg2+ transporter protein-domain-containing protein n=1 Tax=Echria macrotheca TaxID=438768 RepID=A0AAJ0BBL3_9PEZI|nr:cora-like Mg2+ transporter protein-domain-containing protein [Echria macrotheca]